MADGEADDDDEGPPLAEADPEGCAVGVPVGLAELDATDEPEPLGLLDGVLDGLLVPAGELVLAGLLVLAAAGPATASAASSAAAPTDARRAVLTRAARTPRS